MLRTARRAVTERVQVALPALHAGQQAVLDGLRRHTVLCAGRRWRKTTLCMRIAVLRTLRGERIVWGAPTYKQVDVGWGEMRKATGGVFEFHTGHMMATAPSGGTVTFRSLDNPDNARGLSADGVIIDEASDTPEEAWFEVLRPMLVDTQGWSLLGGTPKGRNWFWREWLAADERTDGAAFQAPTRGATVVSGQLVQVRHPLENPEVPWSEMLDIWAQVPERTFRQELLAEFLENAGGVFQQVDACVSGQLPANPQPPDRGDRYVVGLDLAKHNDFTVLVVLDREARRIVDFHRFNLASWPLQKARIELIVRHWNNALVWMDATGVGDPIYDDLARAGLRVNPIKFTNANKTAIIENAVLHVEQRLVSIPRIPVLIGELQAYEYERLPAGALRMNAPGGMHDDTVIAFALALWPLAAQSFAPSLMALEALRRPSEMHGVDLLRKRF